MMFKRRKTRLLALACVSAISLATSAKAATISSTGTFSGTESSNYLGDYFGYYIFSQSGSFTGIDSKFGSFTETTADYGVVSSSLNSLAAVDGSDTATFSNGKIFATFTGSGEAVNGGYNLTDSFDITGGTGVFAGITGTVQDSDFYNTTQGTISGNFITNYSGIVSPVPLPGSVEMFGAALVGLIGFGMWKSRRFIET